MKLKLPFSRNDKGNIAIMTALTMPLLVGSVSFGVEVAYWYHSDTVLQETADKTVYAAALELRAGSNYDKMKGAASTVASDNGFTAVAFNVFNNSNDIYSSSYTAGAAGADGSAATTSGNSLDVRSPPISGQYVGDVKAVQVIVQKSLPLSFAALFRSEAIVEKSSAVAIIQSSGSACVLALSTTAPAAIQVWGSAALNLTGCNVNSNSTASDAVSVGGSGHLSTDCIVTVGQVNITSSNTTQTCAAAITNSSPVGDPYANLPVPPMGTSRPNTNGATLQPGNYSNFSLSGTKTLNPGVYYISSGNVSISPNSDITGSGVTIYLAAGVGLSMNNNARVRLSAPTTGTYKGVLFFSARDNTSSIKFNGTANSLLTGALYFPNQNLEYLGNFSGDGGCTQVVAQTVTWTGNTSIAQDCSAYGMANIPSTNTVKLVE